jgi:DNA integrity scanning protein DisA with diadenylate cyclase activity
MISKKDAMILISGAKRTAKLLNQKRTEFPSLDSSFKLVISEYEKLITFEEKVKNLKRGTVTRRIEEEILTILSNIEKEKAVMDIISLIS